MEFVTGHIPPGATGKTIKVGNGRSLANRWGGQDQSCTGIQGENLNDSGLFPEIRLLSSVLGGGKGR